MTQTDPQQIATYQVLDVIQRSATSVVYKGYQASLDRAVAIKLLSTHNPSFAATFKREARALGQLEHHNILPIYDYGELDGQLYIVMQFVNQGFTLADIRGDYLDPLEALRLGGHLLDGLSYAHRRGVLHRNIKPSNIFLPLPDWPLLADFGLAQLAGDQSQTLPSLDLASVTYIAPEQAEGRELDERTDLYTLGAVLYELVTGHVPFEAHTPVAMLRMHVSATPAPPSSHRPDLPAALDALLLRALAKSPSERYPNARAMADEIRSLVGALERGRQHVHIAEFYRAGLLAFDDGEWSTAIEQFDKVLALDPHYQQAEPLRAWARRVHERARTQGRRYRARLQRQNKPAGPPEPAASPAESPFQTRLMPSLEAEPAERRAPWLPPIPRWSLMLLALTLVVAIVVAIALIV